jgi:hypothetical protein
MYYKGVPDCHVCVIFIIKVNKVIGKSHPRFLRFSRVELTFTKFREQRMYGITDGQTELSIDMWRYGWICVVVDRNTQQSLSMRNY